MKRKLHALAGIVAALALAAVAAAPAAADRGSYQNWHVHDGGTGVDANGLVTDRLRSSRPSSAPPISWTRPTVRTRPTS